MSYNFIPLCIFWETNLYFIWVGIFWLYPLWIQPRDVLLRTEAERTAILLLWVDQSEEGKLPLEGCAGKDFQPNM